MADHIPPSPLNDDQLAQLVADWQVFNADLPPTSAPSPLSASLTTDTVRLALAAASPALAELIVVVEADHDDLSAQPVVRVWSAEDSATVLAAVQGVALAQVVVRSSPLEAAMLGAPPPQPGRPMGAQGPPRACCRGP